MHDAGNGGGHVAKRIARLEALVAQALNAQPPAGASLLAQGFADNPAPVARANGDTILASVIVTPRVTGKFRIIGTVVMQYSGNAVAPSPVYVRRTYELKIGHGVGPTIDYAPGAFVDLLASQNATGNNTSSASIQFQTGAFPLNAPVQLDLIVGGGNSDVTCPANGAQITVEELPN